MNTGQLETLIAMLKNFDSASLAQVSAALQLELWQRDAKEARGEMLVSQFEGEVAEQVFIEHELDQKPQSRLEIELWERDARNSEELFMEAYDEILASHYR